MFRDEAEIYVKAGDGGNGCVSFRREKYVPRGGPDGGDGGNGGSVIIRAVNSCYTLLDLIRKRSYEAKNGKPGEGKKCSGRKGPDLIIEVPPGTLIRDEQDNLLADLKEHNNEYIAAHGGRGGRGNTHFASSTHQTPREAEDGTPGTEANLKLELKLIADVGLVGFPNAGKSTLLSRISAARPKIANYPFTTLIPQLGIVDLSDYRQLVVADIPGIIEGAHQGIGLGDKFLKHIERTRILIYVIEMTPEQKLSPVASWQILKNELRSYSEVLAAKPFLIAANKMDLTGTEAELQNFQEQIPEKVYPISGVTGKGLKKLLQAVLQKIEGIDTPPMQ